MTGRVRIALVATVIALCLGPHAAAEGRRLALADVMGMETFGSAAFSPDGRWLVYERRGPYDQAPRFDRGHRSQWAVTDLRIVDLQGALEAETLLTQQPGRGLVMGEWSPDGGRLIVYRLVGEAVEAGIVTMADRSVQWTGLTPDLPITGSGTAWLDPDRLALTVRPSGELPWMMRFDGTGATEMTERWTRTQDGRTPSRTVVETRDGHLQTDAEPVKRSLILIDTVGRQTRLLAQGTIRDIAASPDGASIAILRSAESTRQDPQKIVVQSAVLTRSSLSILNVSSGRESVPDASLDVAPHLLRWSPESDRLLVWARRADRPWNEGSLLAMKVDGALTPFALGDLDPLPQGSTVSELLGIRADWLDGAPVIKARQSGSGRMDWWSLGGDRPLALTTGFSAPPDRLAAVDKETVLAFGDGRLWLGDTNGRWRSVTADRLSLTDGEPSSLLQPVRLRASETPRRAWATARSGLSLSIVTDHGRVNARAGPDGCEGVLLGRAASERALASICISGGIETLRLATRGGDRAIDAVNANFAAIQFAEPRAIQHQDVRGRSTTSWLFLPPGLRADQVKGVLVTVYPGGADDGRLIQAAGLQMGLSNQLLAAEGYAVLSAALAPESDSLRSAMIDDFNRGTDLAVDAMLDGYPSLPKARMALLGHSFGGYAALAVATRSERFQTYVSWAGPTDMFGRWGEFLPHARIWPEEWFTLNQPMGAVEVGQAALGAPPWEAVESYAAASPYLLADRIEAPILLIASDRDYVPLTQAERMLTALHRRGRTAKLVTYWGETHTNASPANIRDVYDQIFAWLDQTLDETPIDPTPRDAAPMSAPIPRMQP